MRDNPSPPQTPAQGFGLAELHSIYRRAEREAEREVARGAEEAGRGPLARVWLRLADAAYAARAAMAEQEQYERGITRTGDSPPEPGWHESQGD